MWQLRRRPVVGVGLIVVCHARTPLLERRLQRAVKGLRFCLQKEMSTCPAPLHLLLLGEALADDGVDGRLDEGRGYPFSRPVVLAVVDQAGVVCSDIGSEFADRRQELSHVGIIGFRGFGIVEQLVDLFVRSVGVAMSQVPFDPGERVQHAVAGFLVMMAKTLSKLAKHDDVEPVQHMLAGPGDHFGE